MHLTQYWPCCHILYNALHCPECGRSVFEPISTGDAISQGSSEEGETDPDSVVSYGSPVDSIAKSKGENV